MCGLGCRQRPAQCRTACTVRPFWPASREEPCTWVETLVVFVWCRQSFFLQSGLHFISRSSLWLCVVVLVDQVYRRRVVVHLVRNFEMSKGITAV